MSVLTPLQQLSMWHKAQCDNTPWLRRAHMTACKCDSARDLHVLHFLWLCLADAIAAVHLGVTQTGCAWCAWRQLNRSREAFALTALF